MSRKVVAAGRAGTKVFPQSALSAAASVNEEAMPYDATIWVYGSTEDAGGDVSEGFTQGPTVPARIGPIGGGMISAGQQVNEASTHVVTFGRAVSIKRTDEVEIEGTRYAVTAAGSYGPLESGRRIEVREL